MDRCLACRRALSRTRARALPSDAVARRSVALRRASRVLAHDAVSQHHSARAGREVARQSRARAQDPLGDSLERGRDHPAREQGFLRARRAYRELSIFGTALRHRLRTLMVRAFYYPRTLRDPRTTPRVSRHIRERIRRRTVERAATSQLPPGSRRQGHSLVSASVADAGVLAIPDGVDGPGSLDGDLPGAVSEI